MNPAVPLTRGALLVVAAFLAASACGGGSSSPRVVGGEAASCAGPYLSLTHKVARVGETVPVAGRWFAADCYDTGQPGAPPPLTDLRLQLSQSGQIWTVASGVAASGPQYTFNVAIQVPHGVHPGPAKLAVKDYGRPIVLHVAR
jgi:hypothetical protein